MSTVPPHADPSASKPASTEHDALAAGTRFGEFEIVRVLGVGGFGIVYLARDHSLERDVALKEYMPASLAARGAGPQITIRSSSFAETYAIGLRSFVNEARLLARFDHASLVKVYRFWEDNATAYMVMPYLQGITLRDARRAMTHAPDEAWVRSVIDPILSALELLHREGVYHRDIAPDNILLPPDAAPVLLDFGAARRVISDRTQSLTAILKPSYAPIEQYAEMTQLRQGPWTDLYALGAVVHYLLFGVPPAPATARAVQDDGESIADRSVAGVSPRMLEAVAWALAIRPSQRPQSAEEFRAALDGRIAIPALGRQSITLPPAGLVASAGRAAPATPAADDEPTMQVESTYTEATRLDTAHMPASRSDAPPRRSGISADMSAPGAPAPVASAPRTGTPAGPTGVPAAQAAVALPSSSKLGLVFAGLAVFVVAAGAVVWQFGFEGGAVVGTSPAASAVATRSLASAAAPSIAPVARVALPVAPAPALVVAPPPAALLPAAARAETPAGPAATLPASNAAATAKAATATGALAASVAASHPKATPRGKSADLAAAPNVAAEQPGYAAATPSIADGRTRSSATREPARPVVAADPGGPKSAREACGSRVFIALAICMDRECEQARFRNTAECIRVLEVKRARENR